MGRQWLSWRFVGAAIPIPARLMAAADVYDALISHRVYKAALTHAQAVKIIVVGKNSHFFDPDIVDAFVQAQYQHIAAKLTDNQLNAWRTIPILEP